LKFWGGATGGGLVAIGGGLLAIGGGLVAIGGGLLATGGGKSGTDLAGGSQKISVGVGAGLAN